MVGQVEKRRQLSVAAEYENHVQLYSEQYPRQRLALYVLNDCKSNP